MPFVFFTFTPVFPDFHFRYTVWYERFLFNFRFLSCICHARVIRKQKSMSIIANTIDFRVVTMRSLKWKTLSADQI